MTDDPQQVWTAYYARIRRRRIAEAHALHSQMAVDGVTDDTILALDFVHFGSVERDIRSLSEQLSENYAITVTQRADADYWNAEGTTRPDGVDGMNAERCAEWVAFMCDVAHSYGCVFSSWRLADTVRDLLWTNEMMHVGPEINRR